MRLADQVALVTGVSRAGQIGQAVARALAENGARLVLVARVTERAEEIRTAGGQAAAVAADLTAPAGAALAVERALHAYGRLDTVVNLAGGLTVYKPGTDHSPAEWTAELNNNLLTAFLVTRAAWGALRDAGGGAVINFARAGLPQANMLAYNCAKAGVEALTRTFALEGREFNIRVNAIAPGLTDTEANLEAMKPKDTARWARRTDIGAAAVFLASAEADGITGQVLAVAGKGI